MAGVAGQVDGIVLTGSLGSMIDPVDVFCLIKERIDDLGEVMRIDEKSGSLGSAQIANAVFNGEKDILGIPVLI